MGINRPRVSQPERIAGRYEVIKTLAGGMGVVFLCRDAETQLPVALKTFLPQYLADRAARDRFLREGATWVDIGLYPHVVRALQVQAIRDRREVYIVLEWIAEAPGNRDASLRSWLAPGRPLPAAQALLFSLHVARGMRHAAGRVPGLVHRDLKPENVLIGRDGYARVTDFGLVTAVGAADVEEAAGRQAEAHPGRTQLTGRGVVGTPLYMAPEQWSRGEQLDARADIYAVGCILYEMLSGRLAFSGSSLEEIERAHLSGEVEELPTGLPAGIVDLVKRCLSTDRRRRYSNWEETETALAEVYQTLTGTEAPAAASDAGATKEARLMEGFSYNSIGAAYHDIGKFDLAAQYFDRALEMGRAEVWRELEAAGLTGLSLVYQDTGDSRRALELSLQALEIAQDTSDLRHAGVLLGNIGIQFFQLGEVQQALSFYGQALEIAEKVGDLNAKGRHLGNIGNLFRSMGDNARAVAFFEQALEVARTIGDRLAEGRMLNNIGGAYLFGRQDPKHALAFFSQALQLAVGNGDRLGEANSVGNIGNARLVMQEPREAVGPLEQQLAITREIGDRNGEGRALGNLATAYSMLGDRERAVEYYWQRLAIAQETGDSLGAAKVSLNLAQELAKQGRPGEALEQAQYAARVFSQAGLTSYAQLTEQLIAELNDKRGQ